MLQARLQKKANRILDVLRIVVPSTIAVLAVVLALQSSISVAVAAPGPSMTMTMSEEGGHGRIVFHWPNGVPHYSADVTSGVLVVKFDKPFNVDTDEFLRQMPHVAALVRQDPDRMTLRVALKFDCWVNTLEAENSVYVDLMPSSWTGAPPPLPADVIARMKAKAEAIAQAAAEAKAAKAAGVVDPVAPNPELDVRVASHDGITRLVFDWNQPVLYSLVQKNGEATITFDRSAKVALAQIRVNPPPFLKTITSIDRDGHLSVFLKLADNVSVTDFREDLGVVLDLKQQIAQASPEDNEDTTPPAPEKAASAGTPEPIAPKAKAAPEVAEKTETPEPVTPHVEKVADAAPHEPMSLAPKAALEPVDNEPAVTPATEAAASEQMTPVYVKVAGDQTSNRSELIFPWTEATGAAVFERTNQLWVVFDRPAVFDLSALDFSTLTGFGKPTVLKVDNGSALVFPIEKSDLLVGAEEVGTSWHVALAKSLASAGRSIALSRNWSASGDGYVSANMSGARKVIDISDPQVHDRLLVATARGATQSMQVARSFIEFQALKTAQGIAILPLADDLNVAAAPDAVIISRQNGLALSADNENGSSSGESDPSMPSPAEMDFAKWRGVGNFQAERQTFLKRIVMSAPADESATRMGFGRFLLAYRLAPEALTQFTLALKADSRLDNDVAFHALRGVGEVMAHRDHQALADLGISELHLDPNAAAWRGLAYARLGQMDEANKDFDFAGTSIDANGPAMATEMHLAAAQAAIAMNDLSSAHVHLGNLPPKIDDKHLMARAMVLRGNLLSALKKPGEAINFYDRAIAIGDPEETVRARFAKVMLQSTLGKLPADKVIAELDRLRMMWRGDELELDILAALAKKQLAAGNVVEALQVMRAATVNFPQSDKAQALGAKMPEIFGDYFMGPSAKKLPALKALTFYYEFQNLTPIGQKGDELIRNLAERLVSLDLLAQAEVLLKYQVDQRLHGSVAKAQVAARLAGIYLMDNKPKDALTTLRSTMQNALPTDLADKRQMLEARAFASLKKYDLALDLLSELDGPKVDDLRAEIYWESKNWDAAGQASEAMADMATEGQAPDLALSDDVRFDIMRSAIAYAMGSNSKGLARLREKFGARMSTSVDASAFAVVSDPIETSGVAFRQLASRIAGINMIERFVNSLKDNPPAGSS